MLKYFFGLRAYLTDKTVYLDCKDQSWRGTINVRGFLKCLLLLSSFDQNRSMKTNVWKIPAVTFSMRKNLGIKKTINICNIFHKALLISTVRTDGRTDM